MTRGIVDFLGLDLPTDRVIVPPHHCQADQFNYDWIALYHAMAGYRK